MQSSLRLSGARKHRVVCILCPGPVGSARAGGIGTCLSNFLLEIPRIDPTLHVEVIDTRGPGHIAFFPFYYVPAAARVLRLTLAGCASLIHVNLAERGSTLRKIGFAAMAAALRVPSVIHLHGSNYDKFYRDLHAPARHAVRWMFRRASRIVVLSRHWQRFVIEDIGIPPERVVVVCNGVRKPAAARGTIRQAMEAAHVVFLGRLEERKGLSDLLAALASLDAIGGNWHATIAGDGNSKAYRYKAHCLGLDGRVEFPGWLDSTGVSALLRSASVLVLPSVAEGLPMAILEALSHRVPVVTTPVGSIPEFLTDGESAFLVEPRNPDEVARTLSKLIRSPEMRARLAEGGWRVFEKNFDAAIMTQKLVSIYRCVEAEAAR